MTRPDSSDVEDVKSFKLGGIGDAGDSYEDTTSGHALTVLSILIFSVPLRGRNQAKSVDVLIISQISQRQSMFSHQCLRTSSLGPSPPAQLSTCCLAYSSPRYSPPLGSWPSRIVLATPGLNLKKRCYPCGGAACHWGLMWPRWAPHGTSSADPSRS
jgi:hypothetical protein